MPGTPVCIFTAFGSLELATKLIRQAEQQDVWGDGTNYPMIQLIEKRNMGELEGRVQEFKGQIEQVDAIEVSTGGVDIGLTEIEKKALRLFGRRFEGAGVKVSPLGGGLSGSRIFRAQVFDHSGAPRALAAAKIGVFSRINDEVGRYLDNIIRLDHGSFAALMHQTKAGLGNHSAVFHRLSEGYETSFFELVASNDDHAAEVVKALVAVEEPWTEGVGETAISVSELRQQTIADEDMEEVKNFVEDLNIREFEGKYLQVCVCCQHGDLHGANILTNQEYRPVLIDYGEVGFYSSALDPISLELGLLFHPQAQATRQSWPSCEQARSWFNLDIYLDGCPFPKVIRACRDWAFHSARDRQVYATLYSHALKQLGYPDTDKQLARGLIQSAIEAYETT